MNRGRRSRRGGRKRSAAGILIVLATIPAAAALADGFPLRSLAAVFPAGLLPVGAAEAAPERRVPSVPAGPPPSARPPLPDGARQGAPLPVHEFYFTRVAYSGGGGGFRRRRQSWATDYPKSDRQFLVVLERLTGLDMFPEEHPRLLTDERLNRFPFLYAVEVGHMSMAPAEVAALREFLLRGGFLVVDDFWGSYEWEIFEHEMRRVFPEYPIVDVPLEHEIFHNFYDIDEIVQVPNVNNGMRGWATHERDGYEPFVKGIFDDEGRLMVIVNWNTDLGDAWEWAENPYYPLKYSTYAYQMGVNFIIYAMSH